MPEMIEWVMFKTNYLKMQDKKAESSRLEAGREYKTGNRRAGKNRGQIPEVRDQRSEIRANLG
ncbi:MAG: hypothetical protein JW927_15220 [Deltaproteobacteria bacterium]|nr:hypothetical protein [Deltaproteobacteria bacterium]